LKPDYVFWNMCIPWPGTEVYAWYQKHGHVGDLRNFSTLIDPHGRFRDPVAYSIDFSIKHRVRAWLMANLETHRYFRDPRDVWRLIILSLHYRICKSFGIYFVRHLIPEVAHRLAGKFGRLAKIAGRLIWQEAGYTQDRSRAESETPRRSCERVS
jgi:hypothetical protein